MIQKKLSFPKSVFSNIFFEEKPIPDMRAHQIFLRDPAGNRVELNFEGEDR